jgi:hypothetical protein
MDREVVHTLLCLLNQSLPAGRGRKSALSGMDGAPRQARGWVQVGSLSLECRTTATAWKRIEKRVTQAGTGYL